MKNDFRRLKEEADIGMVLAYLNVPVQRKGANYFLQCPNPKHDDEHFTNCYYKDGWNNVYCCACGKTMKAIDIIMWHKGCTYGEAADILWQIEGCPDWYYSKGKKKNLFQVSREELELIGLHTPGRVLAPKQLFSEKRKLAKGAQYDSSYMDGYLLCDVKMYAYRDFLTEKQFIHLVRQKAKEASISAEESASFFKRILEAEQTLGIQDKYTEYLHESCMEKINICKEICERARKAAA